MVGAAAILAGPGSSAKAPATTSFQASSSDPLAGSAGTDTSLKDTASAVTVHGRGDFANLTIDVNQTMQLVNQGISLKWSGGVASYSPPPQPTFSGVFGGDYLQIMECWGDDDGTVPGNPGPPPTQCEFGGENRLGTKYPTEPGSLTYTRALAFSGWTCGPTSPPGCLSYTQAQALPADQAVLAKWGIVYAPFHAVDGKTIPFMTDPVYGSEHPIGTFDQNPYFDFNTTNEIDYARTFGDGSGQEIFQVDTGEEAPGLGCGQSVEAHSDGTSSVPKCWIVVVPRSTGDKENPTGPAADNVVDTSPLAPSAWRNRIAIPLDFNPLATSCAFGTTTRRIVGGEVASLASASWQPALCAQNASVAYAYEGIDDGRVRDLITSGSDPESGMGVVSRPADPSTLDPTTPAVYAPLAVSGVAVAFNIQRLANLMNGQPIPAEQAIAGTRIQHLYLTPRLVAKLLTQSYKGGFLSPPPGDAYKWLADNPTSMFTDKDFIQFNPEFAELQPSLQIPASTVITEARSSDANNLVWQWILDDPSAKAFLNGDGDGFGMKVNPYYSINPSINPAGSATPTGAPDTFPKSDPYCVDESTNVLPLVNFTPRNLCVLDWWPYVGSMHDAAAATLSTKTGSTTSLADYVTSPETAWTSDGPEGVGKAMVMSITDTADAARFGLQTAALSRAGDDGTTPTFVAPATDGLVAGVNAMQPSAVQGVLAPNPTTTAAGAYPLTIVSYAMLIPLTLDPAVARDYGEFIKFAADAGQVPGFAFGNLPPGYAPLPSSMASQADSVAASLVSPPQTTTTTTTAPSTTTTTASAPVTAAPVAAPAIAPPPPPAPSAPSSVAPAPSTTVPIPPAPPPLAAEQPPAQVVPIARTSRSPVGLVRYVWPLALALGAVTGVGAGLPGLMSRRRRI